MTWRTLSTLALLVTLLAAPGARAQDVALPEPIEPTPNAHGAPEIAPDADREIDLANVVLSAARGVTTVQEAPAIITIITSEEIQARGFRFVEDALATVPGWSISAALGQQVPGLPLVRGVGQSVLLLRDGITMFDPFANNQHYRAAIPIESIKRLEIVTGPGGVLWGANSFMGIVNVIMKDAEDVNGLEVSAGYGDGPGFRSDVKAYAMFGKTFLGGKLKIFQHVSYETYIGPTWNNPQLFYATPAPQPEGPAFFGPLSSLQPQRSSVLIVDGKYSFGPVSLIYQIPFASMYQQIEFINAIVPNNNTTGFDRFVVLDYHDRFWKDRFGLTVKGYWSQFVSDFNTELDPPMSSAPPFTGPLGPNIGGVHYDFNPQWTTLIQRTGLTADADINLQRIGLKILFGGEFFYEGISNSTEPFASAPYSDPNMAMTATGMPDISATPSGLPLICPQMSNGAGGYAPIPQCPRPFVADQYRLVAAGYADLQYRPVAKLTLDGGVRLQYGFGGRGYAPTPIYSGAAVWNFLPDYHAKLNYTTGFRTPPFNDTDAVAGGIDYAANPRLKNEASQSFQGELNARLLRNVRKVRQLEVRLDYSYTVLTNLIQFHGSQYANTGSRAIHSVEGLAKLYLSGDHYFTASYTYLDSVSSDLGVFKNLPNQSLSLGGSFNLIKNVLDVNANLLVTGAYTDPNRVPTSTNPGAILGATTQARATDLSFDHLTPVALLQLGFRLRVWQEKLVITGQFYNVLNQRYWYPDPWYDVTPSEEMTPTPAPGFSFFARASYHF